MSATSNDLFGQLEALRDLGALPPDTDLKAVIKDLGLDRPPVDPTTLSADELVHEIQQTIKALLGIGAKLPKELMLFVKNLVFLDGAVATLAPNLDIISEIGEVSMHFATAHGERLAAELGFDASAFEVDLSAMKVGMGIAEDQTATYKDLQERRELIRERLQSKRR
jgi:ubiquinone biosynthesis protein